MLVTFGVRSAVFEQALSRKLRRITPVQVTQSKISKIPMTSDSRFCPFSKFNDTLGLTKLRKVNIKIVLKLIDFRIGLNF